MCSVRRCTGEIQDTTCPVSPFVSRPRLAPASESSGWLPRRGDCFTDGLVEAAPVVGYAALRVPPSQDDTPVQLLRAPDWRVEAQLVVDLHPVDAAGVRPFVVRHEPGFGRGVEDDNVEFAVPPLRLGGRLKVRRRMETQATSRSA